MRRTLELLLAFAVLTACAPHSAAPPVAGTAAIATIQDISRIVSVLQGLRPAVEITGRVPIRWTLEERITHHNVPGVSIAVIENGRIAWTRAIGVEEVGKPDPVTPTTLFQAGSLSKPVAATAMLRLAERGMLDLDADVNGYLTSWQVPENRFTAADQVTLRRLVRHSAGITVPGFRGYAPGEPLPTLAQVLNEMSPANNPPVVVDTFPGAVLRYSGGGFVVLQQLLTDVTGQPFPELMRRLVLDPAGMQRSTYEQPLPASLADEAARGHDPRGPCSPAGGTYYRSRQRRGSGPRALTWRSGRPRSRTRTPGAPRRCSRRRWPERCSPRRRRAPDSGSRSGGAARI